jgi:type I restriction enzyme, S subunit
VSDKGFLERLLNGADVEWVPLAKILFRTKGTKITAGQMKTLHKDRAPLKIFAGGKTVAFVNFGDIPNKDVNKKPSIIVKSRGVIAFEYYDQPFSHKNELWSYHSQDPRISIKFVYYFLKLNEPYFQGIGSKMQMPQISTPITDDFLIPLPCPDDPEKSLAIQEEIVRILDSFAALTAELTAELAARKKQYNHYREKILTSEVGGLEWRALDELGEFIRGKRFTKADYRQEGIGAIHYGEIYTHYGVYAHETLSKVRSDMAASLRFAEKNDLIIAGVSETVEDVGKAVAWLGQESVAIHDDSYAFRHSMNPKFIAYAMQIDAFHDQKTKYVSSGKIKRLLIDGMKQVKIPLPFPDDPKKSLAEQARIVTILDKFDTLTTSLTEGLPREIELRQQQYEYYRDLLLSFAKPAKALEA